MFFSRQKLYWYAGDQPPRGGYMCADCCCEDSYWDISREGQKLPRCPVCDGKMWMRI